MSRTNRPPKSAWNLYHKVDDDTNLGMCIKNPGTCKKIVVTDFKKFTADKTPEAKCSECYENYGYHLVKEKAED